ncbi:AI-2E family transporter [Clostridium niameyense]|uniref:AI-2E family transporter n=1 Tax=Clostridium niameyense TaxID=1622073 RepID=A0A6M0R8S1_9CLOT|nr:AI-2E family transporter [Clostridium niameyense]NEZ45969.1 AI-2E family transporter [Clostridium niameyense]
MKIENKFKNYKYIIIIPLILILLYLILKNEIVASILNLIFISFFIYYFIKPIHRFLKNKGVGNKLGAIILILSLISLIILIVTSFVPAVFKESLNINKVIINIEQYIEKFYDKVKILKNNKSSYVILDKLGEKFNSSVIEFENKFFKSLLNIGANILDIAVVPIIVYYFLAEGESIRNKILIVFPVKFRELVKNIFEDIDKVIGRYIVSQVLLSLIIGVATFIILVILKIDFPILLSFLNAFFNIIPYFGPIIGSLPAILIALMKSYKSALWTLCLLYLLQQIEGNIIAPKVTGDSIDMHPLTIIFLLTIGGKLYGFIGMVIAIPIGVVLKVIYEDLNYYLF